MTGLRDGVCRVCGKGRNDIRGNGVCNPCSGYGDTSTDEYDNVPPRYIAKGREVWDSAWSNPFTGSVTAGIVRESVVVVYPSVQAAYEAAESLNENEPVSAEAHEARFREAARNALADAREDADVRGKLLPAWVTDIDGLDSL